MKISKALLGQTARFVFVGAVNTGIDFLVFNLLAYYVIGLENGWAYFFCKSIAFLAAMVNSFFFNSRFTFKGNGQKDGVWWRFSLITITAFLISSGISTAAFNVLVAQGVPALIAGNISVVVSIMVGMVINFIGYKQFVFKSHEEII